MEGGVRRRCRLRGLVRPVAGWRMMVHVADGVVHVLHGSAVVHATLDGSGGGMCSSDMLFVAAPRVGVAVDARVAGQLVGAAEAFGASRELTAMWLLARVGADVARLVLETVKGLVAERALVGTGEVGAVGVILMLHHVDGHGRGGGGRGCHGRGGGGLRLDRRVVGRG